MPDLAGLFTIVVVPIGRALIGWLENALKDSKIDLPEWKQLVQTVLVLGLPAAALYWGFDMPAELAVSIPLVIDLVFHYVKVYYEKIQVIKAKVA
jgi:hypothetical protein